MSPKTGRPPKKGRTDKTITIRLSEQENELIEKLAEYFKTSKNNIIVESMRYLERYTEEYEHKLGEQLEKDELDFVETEIEKRLERYENRILNKLEKWETKEKEKFYEETLPNMEEEAEVNERVFDRDEAIYNFDTYLEERRNEVEEAIREEYEQQIEEDLEEEWEETEKYAYIREFFGIEE